MTQQVITKTGVVKFYNITKGYGFIVDDETKEEIFVHATGLTGGNLASQDVVSFDLTQGKKGLMAVNVKKK